MSNRASRARRSASRAGGSVACVLFLALAAAACSKPVDLKQALQITDISSGWYDVGVVDGKNKLVPSVTFTLRRSPGVELSAASLNVMFKNDAGEVHDEKFIQKVDFGADGASPPIVVRAENGYTGEPPQSRLDMLKNSHFRDIDVEILARESAAQWISLRKERVARQLLTK
jgi:hypothetical protein